MRRRDFIWSVGGAAAALPIGAQAQDVVTTGVARGAVIVNDDAGGIAVDVAGATEAPADLEILTPDLEIANLSAKGRLEITLTIGRGRGYMPAELNRSSETTIGVIPIDSIFSPVRRVSYEVEAARVGQRTDYDKLVLDVTTDGSIEPRDAIGQAADTFFVCLG